MSNLIKHTPGQLSTEAGQVLRAYEGQPVKDTNDSDLYAVIQRLVQETAEAVGHKNTFRDATQLNLVVKDILNSIKYEHKGLRLEEIKLAYSLGRVGRFGEFTNLKSRVFCEWLRAYKSEIRQPAMMKAEKEESGPTPQEIEAKNRESRERIKAQFLEVYDKSIQAGENLFTDEIQNKLFYGLLSDFNIIPYKDPRKDKIYAETRLKMAKNWQVAGKSRNHLKDFFEKSIGPLQNQVVSECRRVFFHIIIQDCLDNLEDLKDRF